MLEVILQILGFLFVVNISSERRKQLREWGVPLAFKIANARGWVSTHRLMDQLHLTRSDAQIVLVEAMKLGVLYQAVNGRYYVVPDAVIVPNEIDATAVEEQPRKKVYSTLELSLIFLIGITALTGVFLVADRWPKIASTASPPPARQATEKPSPQAVVLDAIKEAAEVSMKSDGSYEVIYKLDPVLSLGVKRAREQSLHNAAAASDSLFRAFDDAKRVIVKATATHTDKKRAGQAYTFNTVTFSRSAASNKKLKDVAAADVPKIADSYWENPSLSRVKN